VMEFKWPPCPILTAILIVYFVLRGKATQTLRRSLHNTYGNQTHTHVEMAKRVKNCRLVQDFLVWIAPMAAMSRRNATLFPSFDLVDTLDLIEFLGEKGVQYIVLCVCGKKKRVLSPREPCEKTGISLLCFGDLSVSPPKSPDLLFLIFHEPTCFYISLKLTRLSKKTNFTLIVWLARTLSKFPTDYTFEVSSSNHDIIISSLQQLKRV
jgi:hypothetical protein